MAYATVISTGLDGKPHVWPANAISCKNGVYRDYRGRIVPGVGVANDAAITNVDEDKAIALKLKGAVRKVKAEMDAERKADRAIRRLFPSLQIAVAMDDKDAEQAAMGTFSSEEESEAEDEATFEDALIASAKASRQYWQDVHKRNAERSGASYGNANYQHSKKTLGKGLDAQQRNARTARQYSAFTSSARLCKGFHK